MPDRLVRRFEGRMRAVLRSLCKPKSGGRQSLTDASLVLRFAGKEHEDGPEHVERWAHLTIANLSTWDTVLLELVPDLNPSRMASALPGRALALSERPLWQLSWAFCRDFNYDLVWELDLWRLFARRDYAGYVWAPWRMAATRETSGYLIWNGRRAPPLHHGGRLPALMDRMDSDSESDSPVPGRRCALRAIPVDSSPPP